MGYLRRGNGIQTAFCCACGPLLMRQETDYLTSDKSRPNPGERDSTAVTTDCLQHSTQARVPETLWSVVFDAKDGSWQEAQATLDSLCRSYSYRFYAFLRRSGHNRHDAEGPHSRIFRAHTEQRLFQMH